MKDHGAPCPDQPDISGRACPPEPNAHLVGHSWDATQPSSPRALPQVIQQAGIGRGLRRVSLQGDGQACPQEADTDRHHHQCQ
jgi:hypothetical protein